MAVTKTILKLTERDAVVKVAGGAGSATVDLQTDLKRTNEVLGTSQLVPITGVQWTGSVDAVVTIARNGVTIMTLNCAALGQLEMQGQMMVPDTIEQDKDITITVTGAAAEVWIRLKKTSGYTSGVETSVYGQYDNPAVVGA